MPDPLNPPDKEKDEYKRNIAILQRMCDRRNLPVHLACADLNRQLRKSLKATQHLDLHAWEAAFPKSSTTAP